MFEIVPIGSSSAGNSYILKTKNEFLILECGVSYKTILIALQHKLDKVSGCLVSHEHKDHSAAVKEFVKAGIDIYSSTGTLDSIGILNHRTHKVKALQLFNVGGFDVLPFDTQHDAKEPLGFLIHHKEMGKLLFITDSYYCKYIFTGLTHIMVECNYSKSIIEENLKNGTLDKGQANRLLKSHFSLEKVKEFLLANNLSEVKEILLMHLSNRNSNAAEFQEEIEKLTGIPVRVC